MTMGPDDIPQWAWDEAMKHSDRVGQLILRKGPQEELDLPVIVARAILKAKNDAYEECAAVADASEDDWMASGVEGIPRDIAAAIRNLKHETEV